MQDCQYWDSVTNQTSPCPFDGYLDLMESLGGSQVYDTPSKTTTCIAGDPQTREIVTARYIRYTDKITCEKSSSYSQVALTGMNFLGRVLGWLWNRKALGAALYGVSHLFTRIIRMKIPLIDTFSHAQSFQPFAQVECAEAVPEYASGKLFKELRTTTLSLAEGGPGSIHVSRLAT